MMQQRSTYSKPAMLVIAAAIGVSISSADTFTWIGGTGNWSDPANWDTGIVPEPRAYIIIDSNANEDSNAQLSGSALIESVTLDAGDTLALGIGITRLAIAGAVVQNDGTIVLGAALTGPTPATRPEYPISSFTGRFSEIALAMPTLVDGKGKIVFASAERATIRGAIDTTAPSIQIGPLQMVTTTAISTLQNEIRGSLLNEGRVEANAGALTIWADEITNTGILAATAGGLLAVKYATIDNAGGILRAESASELNLDDVFIYGGTLAGDGEFTTGNQGLVLVGSTDEPVRIEADSTISLSGNRRRLGLIGQIELDGLIRINSNQTSASGISTNDLGYISGTGTIRFEGPGENRINGFHYLDVLGGLDSAILGPDVIVTTDCKTRHGYSVVGHALINEGTIEANCGELDIHEYTLLNDGVVRAVNGGSLRVKGTLWSRDEGRVVCDSKSEILIEGAIKGGIIDGPNFVMNAQFPRLEGFENASPLTILPTSKIRCVTSGRIVGSVYNDGEILLANNSQNPMTIDLNAELLGNGRLVLEGSNPITFDWPSSSIVRNGIDHKIIIRHGTTAESCVLRKPILNYGTVLVDGGGVRIGADGAATVQESTNSGTMSAINSGQLLLQRVEIDNTDGVIRADEGSEVQLANATISGGRIEGNGVLRPMQVAGGFGGGGVVFEGSEQVPFVIADAAEVLVEDSNTARFSGHIENNGLITVHKTMANGNIATNLGFSDGTVIGGTGEIHFSGVDSFRYVGFSGTVRPLVELGAEQRVRSLPGTEGYTVIRGMTLVVNGLLEADSSRISIRDVSLTNNGVLKAINGGSLSISFNTHVDNTNGFIFVDGMSELPLSQSTSVSGGVLRGNGRILISTVGNMQSGFFDSVTTKPGETIGKITFNSLHHELSPNHTFELEIGGFTPESEHDVVAVEAVARINGTLRAVPANGFAPQVGDRFPIFTATEIEGRFSNYEAVGFTDASLTIRGDYSSPTSVDMVFVRIADMNCDGAITVSDIGPFVTALTDVSGYATQFTDCELLNADTNGDGAVTVSDIGDFVALLTGA